MIHSKELERHLLSALIKSPESYSDIAHLIDEEDFYTENESYVNQTIFKLIKNSQNKGTNESLDHIILIDRLRSAQISFSDNIDIGDYVHSLVIMRFNDDHNNIVDIAKELKGYTVRRVIFETCEEIKTKVSRSMGSLSLPDIIRTADALYNAPLETYASTTEGPENIYADMASTIEELANNPMDAGMLAPHMPYLNTMYGSLLRPGNISVVVARTGVGKTTFCLDFVTKVSRAHEDTYVLHFDNGEMSKLELQMRQCAALSGVPLHLIETGKWRSSGYVDPVTNQSVSAQEVRAIIKKTWEEIATRNFYYYNVAGHSVDQMLNIARRFYYSQVGRGNPMILSFDYIKTTSESNREGKSSWELVGEMVDKFKRFIQNEITFKGRPSIGMITSVQSNRSGITSNRQAGAIVEDESIVALSDQITHFASHLLILRPRLEDEILEEPQCYEHATHRLTCYKYRHLGEDRLRATQPVAIPALDDGGREVGNASLKKNCIFLRMDNFGVEEIGDLRDLAEQMRVEGVRPNEDGE